MTYFLNCALLVFLLITSGDSGAVEETSVQIIALAPPLNQAKAELSGLTWCGDKLVLLPQYPRVLSDNGGSYFYYLERQQIIDYLDLSSLKPLKAKRILLKENGLRNKTPLFDGFEAIACKGEKIWLSIESISEDTGYQSFLVAGTISFQEQALVSVDLPTLRFLGSQSKRTNMGDEAIFVHNDDVITLHEANDLPTLASPKAQRVPPTTKSITTLGFPKIPFRVTDATALNSDNRFWVINYKYSGDTRTINSPDFLSQKYGEGASHKAYDNLERLIELQLEDDSIKLTGTAPISLKLVNNIGRNWEGLVALDNRGFLVVSDKFPSTLFGFIPYVK